MKEYYLNPIPAPTWNWLKVNGTTLALPQSRGEAQVQVVLENAKGEMETEQRDKFAKIPTGMGAGMGEAMSQGAMEPVQILVEKNQKARAFIHIVRHQENLALVPVHIYAKEGASIKVWMDYVSSEGSQGGLGVQTLVFGEARSKVELIQLQLQGDQDIALNDIGGHLEPYAHLNAVQLLLGGSVNFAGARASLFGSRSSFASETGYFGKNQDQIDMNYVADHRGRYTVSEMAASGVLQDEARKLFRGTIDFKRGAKEAQGDEREDVLLLGDEVVNQTVPLILCAEEDVAGNHGATIGNLDDEILFYLSSRGMDKESATNMVARARMDAIGKKLDNPRMEEMLEKYLEERFHGQFAE